jgi:hypothetical protein
MGAPSAKVDVYIKQEPAPSRKSIMTMIYRLIQTAKQARARRRERDYFNAVLRGPDSTFRSELIEVMSSLR